MVRMFTKTELIDEIKSISERGWIENTDRIGNDGAIGNIAEDILGIPENNLPIPNATEWELKCYRVNSSVLTTLFHNEPSPRAVKFVPNIMLPHYGWEHKGAGSTHSEDEKSFRMTMKSTHVTDRGFTVDINENEKRVEISFKADLVDVDRHQEWLNQVSHSVGVGEIDPQPYWGFSDLIRIAGAKFPNMFYLGAKRKREHGKEYFHYVTLRILSEFDGELFIDAIRNGDIYIEFDARSGHNHGTKFRLHSNNIIKFYKYNDLIF